MITKVIKVKNVNQQIPFDGDASKQWFVEVVNSNFPAPQIGMIMNGVINLTWEPRCLNCEVEVIFHTQAEAEQAVQQANYRRLALGIASKIPGLAKSIAVSMAALILGGILLAVVGQFVDTSGFKSWWKNFNIVAVADTADETVNGEYAAVITNSHDLYESEAIKEIEKGSGVNVRDTFWYVGGGLFIMKDIATENGKPLLMDYDDADDYCERFNGKVPPMEVQEKVLQRKDLPFLKYQKYNAEWTSTNISGDDYALNVKEAAPPIAAYFSDGGVLTADADDVVISFRCMFKAEAFK